MNMLNKIVNNVHTNNLLRMIGLANNKMFASTSPKMVSQVTTLEVSDA